MKKNFYIVLAVITIAFILQFFNGVFNPDSSLVSIDINPSSIVNLDYINSLRNNRPAGWNPESLIGSVMPGIITGYHHIIAFLTSDPSKWLFWVYALSAPIGAIFMYLFLRKLNLRVIPSLFGGILWGFGSVHLTLIYSGHLGVLASVPWFPMPFWAFEKAMEEKKTSRFFAWILPTAVFVGLGTGWEPQRGFYISALWSIYVLYRLWTEHQNIKQTSIKGLSFIVLSGIIGLAVAFPPLKGFLFFAQGGEGKTSHKNVIKEDWGWATQWSFPPEEIVELFAPGFFGRMSGDPEKPYWGRTGRSPNYDETHQGFKNFKQNSESIGLVAFVLTIAAGYLLIKHRNKLGYFWIGVAVVSLLLSFGRFIPVYYLFWKLPFMSKFRNPNKFMSIFAFASAVLSAYSLELLINDTSNSIKTLRKTALYLTAIILAGLLIVLVFGDSIAGTFSPPEWNYGTGYKIVDNMQSALLRALAFGLLTLLTLELLHRKKITAITSAVALSVIGFADISTNNSYFLKYYDSKWFYQPDPVERFLIKESHKEPFRVKFLQRDALFNQYMTFRFAYHKILFIDVPAVSRFPYDYSLFTTLNPYSQFQMSAVKFILSRTPIEDPNVEFVKSTMGFYKQLSEDKKEFPVPVYIYRYKPFKGLMWSVEKVETSANLEETKRKLDSTPLNENIAFINEEAKIPDELGKADVENVKYKFEGKITARVASESNTVLVSSVYYHPDWSARIDGKPAKIHRANIVMQSIEIPSGKHLIEIRWNPSKLVFWLSELIVILGLILVVVLERTNREPE